MTFDYSDHVTAPVEEQFARLNTLVIQLNDAELAVSKAETAVKVAKEQARDISERQLPELMDEMGLAEFVTSAGYKVKVKRSIHASILKARLQEAYDWLDANGHGGIIKRNVTVRFSKNQEDEARELVVQLGGQFPQVDEGMKIESATLRAFVREQLEAGEPIDQELFGIFERRTVQVST